MPLLYQPQRIELELSSYCNAKCIACTRIQINGESGLLYKNPYTILNKHLDYDFLEEKVFSQPWYKHVKQFGSVGNNGDPMMNPEIAKIFEQARKFNPNVGLFAHTNGSIGRKDTWKRLANVFNTERDKFSFSIDGLEDTNHLYRAGVSWKKVMSNVEYFIDEGGRATWKFIPFKHNKHQIPFAFELSKKLGFAQFQIIKNLLEKNDLEKADEIMRKVWANKHKLIKKDFYHPKRKQLWTDHVDIEPECTKGKIVYISSDKKFYPCCDFYYCNEELHKVFYDWWNDDVDWNDLSKHSVKEVLSNKKMFELWASFKTPKMISICAGACSCDGGTQHNIERNENIVDSQLKDTAKEERDGRTH